MKVNLKFHIDGTLIDTFVNVIDLLAEILISENFYSLITNGFSVT